MINLFLTVIETICMLAAVLLLIAGGLICDSAGVGFDLAVQMMYVGIFALIGGMICQKLKELPER